MIKRIKYILQRQSIGNLLVIFFSPIFGYLLYGFSFLTPRIKNIWIFGTYADFTDNSKYLFIHVAENEPDIKAIWISGKRETVKKIKKNYTAYYKWSVKGLYYSLIGKWYIYSRYATDINFWTLGRAKQFNLWHGIGLKRTGFNMINSMSAKTHNPKSLTSRFFLPHIFRRPTYMLSSSPFITKNAFSKAFRLNQDQCVELGYPRNDMFFLEKEKYLEFISKHEGKYILDLQNEFKKYDKVFLYMPTWRETNNDFISDAFPDISKLDKVLQDKNYLFVMKLHFQTKVTKIFDIEPRNIKVLNPYNDIYSLFPFTDVLVTDYSSVYYDYLLLRKEILLYVFDEKEYLSDGNGFFADFNKYTPGVRASNFIEFIDFIETDKSLKVTEENWAVNEFWIDYKGNSSAEISNFIKNKS